MTHPLRKVFASRRRRRLHVRHVLNFKAERKARLEAWELPVLDGEVTFVLAGPLYGRLLVTGPGLLGADGAQTPVDVGSASVGATAFRRKRTPTGGWVGEQLVRVRVWVEAGGAHFSARVLVPPEDANLAAKTLVAGALFTLISRAAARHATPAEAAP